jgi:hypothetical protein
MSWPIWFVLLCIRVNGQNLGKKNLGEHINVPAMFGKKYSPVKNTQSPIVINIIKLSN